MSSDSVTLRREIPTTRLLVHPSSTGERSFSRFFFRLLGKNQKNHEEKRSLERPVPGRHLYNKDLCRQYYNFYCLQNVVSTSNTEELIEESRQLPTCERGIYKCAIESPSDNVSKVV